MASVYILYSDSINSFYIGSCLNLEERLSQHNSGYYSIAFTKKATDWTVFYQYDDLEFELARRIENHIKNMKSRQYYLNLKKYPEIIGELIVKYAVSGSSR